MEVMFSYSASRRCSLVIKKKKNIYHEFIFIKVNKVNIKEKIIAKNFLNNLDYDSELKILKTEHNILDYLFKVFILN